MASLDLALEFGCLFFWKGAKMSPKRPSLRPFPSRVSGSFRVVRRPRQGKAAEVAEIQKATLGCRSFLWLFVEREVFSARPSVAPHDAGKGLGL